MKDNDIHKLIEQQEKERKAELYAEFEQKHNITAEQPDKRKYAIKIASCAAAAVVIICLIVSLPFIMQNNIKNSTRYCSVNDCIAEDANFTLQEYAANNNLPLLYVDWYDIADEIQTKIFVNKDDREDIIFFQENIINGQNGIIVELYITKENVEVDFISSFEERCGRASTIKDVCVSWNFRNSFGLAVFVYKGYKYYLTLEDIADENVITDIIEEMIP